MNDLQMKTNTVINILASDNLKPNKISMALQQFAGLDITSFSEIQTRTLHKHIRAINSILSNYPIKNYDDYALMSEDHLNEILINIQRLCLNLLKN